MKENTIAVSEEVQIKRREGLKSVRIQKLALMLQAYTPLWKHQIQQFQEKRLLVKENKEI